jgi:hypothetical protein
VGEERIARTLQPEWFRTKGSQVANASDGFVVVVLSRKSVFSFYVHTTSFVRVGLPWTGSVHSITEGDGSDHGRVAYQPTSPRLPRIDVLLCQCRSCREFVFTWSLERGHCYFSHRIRGRQSACSISGVCAPCVCASRGGSEKNDRWMQLLKIRHPSRCCFECLEIAATRRPASQPASQPMPLNRW